MVDQMYKLILIVGPTAIGKTAVAVEVASLVKGEIISADSVQIYKGLDIGSGKIAPHEAIATNGKLITHHLISVLSPKEEFNVAKFKGEVEKLIPMIVAKDKIPVLVGGTGLYVEAVIDPYSFPQIPSDDGLRQKLYNQALRNENGYLHSKLQTVDPVSAKKFHPNDLRRIIRALEVYYLTGKPISEAGNRAPGNKESKYDLKYFGLEAPRHFIYEQINSRVDKMINDGLIDEVKQLLNAGLDPKLPALQSLGYRQIIKALQGDYDMDDAINLIKRDTRRYAKRQLTWFKKDSRIIWYNIQEFRNVLRLAEEIVKQI